MHLLLVVSVLAELLAAELQVLRQLELRGAPVVQVEQELEARALTPLLAVAQELELAAQAEKVELVLPEVVLLELLVLVLEQVQSGLEPETETLVRVQSVLVRVQSVLVQVQSVLVQVQ